MRFDFTVLCCDVSFIQPNRFIRLSRVSFFFFFFCRFALISTLYFGVFVFDLGNFGDLAETLCLILSNILVFLCSGDLV